MTKTMYQHMEQIMIPDIEADSSIVQNQLYFLVQILPVLEALRNNDPDQYEIFVDEFQKKFNTRHKPNFSDVLEYSLVFLKNSYGMSFQMEQSSTSYHIESIDCPLVARQLQNPHLTELERKTLCFHCHEFHLRKFFRLFRLDSSLQLYPNGCSVYVEKPKEEKINPLYY
ncbi:MAG: hypothetical protein H3C47_00590 [Candidatus Cloacimonetes bacterium]|nr:hypothetical protein [Candidatus Cloacimonadota bacterium]